MVVLDTTMIYTIVAMQIVAGFLGIYFGNSWYKNIKGVVLGYGISQILFLLLVAFYISSL